MAKTKGEEIDLTKFTPNQRKQIRLGIRLGLESQLDVSVYADYKFTGRQMQRIREAMLEGKDYSEYLSYTYTTKAMRQVAEEKRNKKK